MTGFVAAGLTAAQPVIVIATDAHRAAFCERLARTVDVDGSRGRGLLTLLDARETLDQFMDDGAPHAGRFRDVVGAVFSRVAAAYPGARIAAYGEMVDLLWRGGLWQAAIRLEQLWNDLAREHNFSLLCAYSMANFASAGDADRLRQMCATHSHVLPSEGYATLSDPEARLREVVALQQRARALEDELRRRAAAEAALRLKHEELEAFVENALEGLHWVGPDGTILWANRAELDLVGYEKHEYIGRNIAEFHADRHVIDDMLARLSRNEMLRDYEARLRRKDGSIRTVSIHSRVYWRDGKFAHTCCFTRDISDRKALEEERARHLARERELRLEAQAAARAKDEFLAILSHELRTPLTSMLGWARLVRDRKLRGPEFDRAIEVIERNATTQARLISEILDMTSIVAGKMKLEVRPLPDARPIVEAAVQSLRPAAAAKGLALELSDEAPCGPVVADPDRLQQIVGNLLSNAIKFTPPGGCVRVGCRLSGASLEISVQDTGKGFAPEFLARAFQRFSQEDTTHARVHGGLGLGLALVRHLAELHGGTACAESPGPGKGATFRVRLPLLGQAQDTDHLPLVPPRSRSTPLPSLEGIHVLVVEDDPDSRTLLVAVLEASGARLRVETQTADALIALEEEVPDVVLTDLGLPGEDGYALIRRLRALPPGRGGDVLAAALTAHASSEDRDRALAAGFNVHMAKPVDPDTLVRAVAELVGRRATV